MTTSVLSPFVGLLMSAVNSYMMESLLTKQLKVNHVETWLYMCEQVTCELSKQ